MAGEEKDKKGWKDDIVNASETMSDGKQSRKKKTKLLTTAFK